MFSIIPVLDFSFSFCTESRVTTRTLPLPGVAVVEGGMGGVGRGRHAVAGEELLRGGGGEWRVHGGAEGGGAGHPAGVQVLLRHHHHLVASDGGGEISNQFFFVLR
jgi:hypothetical protein